MGTSTLVYIGDLLEDARREDLDLEFGKYGPIKSTWIATNPPGFAFVEFEHSRDAEMACQGLNGKQLLGSRLRVELSHKKSRPGQPGFMSYVDFKREDGGSFGGSRGMDHGRNGTGRGGFRGRGMSRGSDHYGRYPPRRSLTPPPRFSARDDGRRPREMDRTDSFDRFGGGGRRNDFRDDPLARYDTFGRPGMRNNEPSFPRGRSPPPMRGRSRSPVHRRRELTPPLARGPPRDMGYSREPFRNLDRDYRGPPPSSRGYDGGRGRSYDTSSRGRPSFDRSKMEREPMDRRSGPYDRGGRSGPSFERRDNGRDVRGYDSRPSDYVQRNGYRDSGRGGFDRGRGRGFRGGRGRGGGGYDRR